MSTLSEKIAALHQAFGASGVAYAFGGAQALAYSVAEPRTTHDIDVNVFLPVERSDEILAALPDGVQVTDEARQRLGRDGQVRLWWDDTAVDLFFATVPFHDAAARRVRRVPFGPLTIPVLDATDLTICKAMFGRTKDWLDIQAMRDVDSIDAEEALGWIESVLGAGHDSYSRLEALLSAPPSTASDGDQLPPGLRPGSTVQCRP